MAGSSKPPFEIAISAGTANSGVPMKMTRIVAQRLRLEVACCPMSPRKAKPFKGGSPISPARRTEAPPARRDALHDVVAIREMVFQRADDVQRDKDGDRPGGDF